MAFIRLIMNAITSKTQETSFVKSPNNQSLVLDSFEGVPSTRSSLQLVLSLNVCLSVYQAIDIGTHTRVAGINPKPSNLGPKP